MVVEFATEKRLMRYLKYISIFSLFLIAVLASLSFYPYYLYDQVLKVGINERFLRLEKPYESHLGGEAYPESRMDGISSEEKNLWQNFHFKSFEVPFPIRHPLFTLVPKIEGNEKEGLQMGAEFRDRVQNKMAEFSIRKSFKYNLGLYNQKLFELPIFRDYLMKKNKEKMWEDVFVRDVTLPLQNEEWSLEKVSAWYKVSYFDLVYNLYLLKIRREIFPKHTKLMSFYKNKNFGVIETDKRADRNVDDNYYDETFFVKDDDIIHTFYLQTKKYEYPAEVIRKRFLDTIRYKTSHKDAARSIYARYQKIPYKKKIRNDSFVFLYSAWSHDLDNADFMKQLIFYLERARFSINLMQPLYDYSFTHFGSTFSNNEEILREKAEFKNRRKMKEAIDKKITEEQRKMASEEPSDFESDKDRVNFYLQKAKDQNINTDDFESRITD